MATITTTHPISFAETAYDTAEYLDYQFSVSSRNNTNYFCDVINELCEKLISKINAMPLFYNSLGEYTIYKETTFPNSSNSISNTRSYAAIFNSISDYKFIIGLGKMSSSDNVNVGHIIAGIASASDTTVAIDYKSGMNIITSTASYIKTAINTAYCNNFKMTTYISNSTNGFWFPNNETCNTKILITKVINVVSNEVRYFPVIFNYVNSAQASAATATYTAATTEARIYNGINFSYFLESGFNKYHNASQTCMLRPLTINDWIFTDIYTIDGGFAPYNTGATKIHIDGSDYIYLSNSFLLKIT